MAAADGGSQTKVTDFGGPQIDNPMWSPDGRRLALNSHLRRQAGVFTMECPPEARRCGEPQMFISGGSAPAWLADGTAIFYSSNRAESQQVWRHPLDGGPDTVVTRSGSELLAPIARR